MRISILIVLFFTISCGNNEYNNRENELERKEKELQERELIIQQREQETQSENTITFSNTQNTVKYLFVVIKTDEPVIVENVTEGIPPSYSEEPSSGNGLIPGRIVYNPGTAPFNYYTVESKFFIYKSDIFEIEHFTEDEKYKAMDKYEKVVQFSIEEANRRIALQSLSGRGKSIEAVAKIISKEAYVFDTYEAASKERSTVN